MSTGTDTALALDTDESWPKGMGAGIAGGVVMAAVMLAMGAQPVLAGAIPALYGLAPPANPAAGLVVHLSHGAVLGVAFAALVGVAGVESPGTVAAAGLAWGVATWIALAALVMPVWLSALGFPNAPPFPNLAPPSLLWHLVYGGTVGTLYGML